MPIPSAPELVRAAVELADTATHHDVGEVLLGLVTTSLDLLEVDAVGVLLAGEDGSPTSAASSDDVARRLDLHQLELDQGPGLESFRSGKPVGSVDLDADRDRWPAFAPAARAAGVAAIDVVPMTVADSTIGALSLLRDQPGPLDPNHPAIAASFATAATIAVLHLRDRSATHLRTEQLQHALDSRVVIEQAKGYLARLHGETPNAAFHRLRSHARSHRLPLRTVASLVVEGRLRIP
jgi:hypothetical protein